MFNLSWLTLYLVTCIAHGISRDENFRVTTTTTGSLRSAWASTGAWSERRIIISCDEVTNCVPPLQSSRFIFHISCCRRRQQLPFVSTICEQLLSVWFHLSTLVHFFLHSSVHPSLSLSLPLYFSIFPSFQITVMSVRLLESLLHINTLVPCCYTDSLGSLHI